MINKVKMNETDCMKAIVKSAFMNTPTPSAGLLDGHEQKLQEIRNYI